jgi:hypothetical protein
MHAKRKGKEKKKEEEIKPRMSMHVRRMHLFLSLTGLKFALDKV